MAKYEVKMSCGHTETIQLFGKMADRDRKIAWLEENGICQACRKAERDAEYAAATAAAAEKATEENLPALTGSEKQINWALTIRANKLAELDKMVADINAKIADQAQRDKNQMTCQAARNVLITKTDSRFWIDNRAIEAKRLIAANNLQDELKAEFARLTAAQKATAEVAEVDAEEYAITNEALQVAIDAEIANADNAGREEIMSTPLVTNDAMQVAIDAELANAAAEIKSTDIKETTKMTITTKTSPKGKKSYYVDGARVRKDEIDGIIHARRNEIIEVDYYVGQEFNMITRSCFKLKVVFTGMDSTIMTEAAANALGYKIIKAFTGNYNGRAYLVDKATADVDPADYAISQEAMDVAVEAEIQNANTEIHSCFYKQDDNGNLIQISYEQAQAEADEALAKFCGLSPEQYNEIKIEAEIQAANNTNNEFKYYIQSRRPIAGAVPAGYISATEGEMKAYSLRTDGSISRVPRKVVYGVVAYDHQLTDEQIINYDLHVDPRNPNTEKQEDNDEVEPDTKPEVDPIIKERNDARNEHEELNQVRKIMEKDCERYERLRDRCKSGSPKRKEYNQLLADFDPIIRTFGDKFCKAQDRYNKSLTLRTDEERTATQKAIDEHNADLDARGIKYCATIYYYPNGIEGEDMSVFEKECTSFEQAAAFVRQEDHDGVYVGGIYDAGWQITDRNDNLVADQSTGLKEENIMTNDKINREVKPCDDNDAVFDLLPDLDELNDVDDAPIAICNNGFSKTFFTELGNEFNIIETDDGNVNFMNGEMCSIRSHKYLAVWKKDGWLVLDKYNDVWRKITDSEEFFKVMSKLGACTIDDAPQSITSNDPDGDNPPAPVDARAAKMAQLKANYDATKANSVKAFNDFCKAREVAKNLNKKANEAEKVAFKAKWAYLDFVGDVADDLTAKLITHDIKTAKMSFTSQNHKDTIYFDSLSDLHIKAGREAIFAIAAKYIVFAEYDTSDQIAKVCALLNDAINRGENEFKFPTIDELNAPPPKKNSISDSLARATLQANCDSVNETAPEGWQVSLCTDKPDQYQITFNGDNVTTLDSLVLAKILPPDKFFAQFAPLNDKNFSPQNQFIDDRRRELDDLLQMRQDLPADSPKLKTIDDMIDQLKRDIFQAEINLNPPLNLTE